ncbi:MAG: hypothetical protein IJW00_00635 [Clostridia bacterium]|nr:hypothetical protein [Clostridia bacterium]
MTDRTLQIWESLSDMSDKIIEESVIPVEAAPAAAKQTREKGRFSAFMNHPAMVAMLCAVVSLGVVAAIVMAGRGGAFTPPVAETPHIEETVTQEPSDSQLIPADFASYESIIRMYHKMVEVLPDWAEKHEEQETLFYFPNEQAREWYTRVGNAAFILCPGDRTNGVAHLGYAVKDFNGDGVEELFLLTKDFQVVTLFTQHNGKPVLLEDFWNRKRGYVNENGQIIICGSSGADVSSREIYRLDATTGQLVLEEALGLDGHTEDLQTIYYHQIGEEKNYISEDEFNAIKNQEPYVGFGTEKNRQVLEEDYVPLLSADAPMFSEYDDVLGVFKQFLLCDGSAARDSLFEKLMTAAPTENDRAILKELHVDSVNMRMRPCYTVKDLNFDGQEELILLSDELWVFALFTMADGVPKDLGYTAGWGMDMGAVRPDATVCQIYQSKGQNQTIKIQRMVGGELYDLEEFGVVDEKVWVDFGAESTGDEEIYFYQKVKGQRQKIDGEAYSRLIQQYGIDEVTGFSADAGFENVIPLLSDDDLTADGKG